MNKFLLTGFWVLLVATIGACEKMPTNKPDANNRLAVKMAGEEKNNQPTIKGLKMVKLETSMGDIVLELNADLAPISTQNFLDYVKSGFYDGTIFHRVINNFMIQGGGFDEKMQQKPTKDNIANEAKNGLKNDIGTIAMARTSDPHSASSQFFINVGNNEFLNYPGQDGWGYAVFGKVVQGMDVVNKIKMVKTGNKGFHQDVPLENVVINKATVIE